MPASQSIHEVIFPLSWDLGQKIEPLVGSLTKGMTQQQLRAMRYIQAAGPITLIELAKAFNRDKGQIARLVDDLVKSGKVKRQPNPNDGRSKLLVLDTAGVELFEKVAAIEAAFSDRLVEGISDADLETYFRVSRQMMGNLSAMGQDAPLE